MRFQSEYFVEYFLKLVPYLKITFSYASLSLLFGLALGLLLAVIKLRKHKGIRYIGVAITAIFRSIPPVVLLFLVYYGIPFVGKMISGADLAEKSRLFYVVIAMTIISSVLFSEIMRSAYTSVDKGQLEAAVSTGLSIPQALSRIVFPQAFGYALPSMGNTIIYLIKEGSLGFTIGLVDVFGRANMDNQITQGNYVLEIYIALAVIYWIVSFFIERILKLLENVFQKKYAAIL
jgi:L-cystine transport system permease protein